MVDIVICSLPPTTLTEVSSAPAILKACVRQAGFTAKTIDLGQRMYVNVLNRDRNLFDRAHDFFFPAIKLSSLDKDDLSIINRWVDDSVTAILAEEPKHVGLSVFSVFTHKATYLIAKRIKEVAPHVKIVIGGRSVDNTAGQMIIDLDLPADAEDYNLMLGEYLYKHRLIDRVVIGDGEEQLVDYLNNVQLLKPFADVYYAPIPDYDDYNLDDYFYIGKPSLMVTGSKGCVRQCEFCDIQSKFGKFRYRDGLHVANEMIQLKEKYGISHFGLTDSLANGSLKALTSMLDRLVEYNTDNPDSKITWASAWITRPAGQTPEEIYRKLSLSGAVGLTIGAESGSNNVLKSFNKKTDIEGLYHELELFRKYKIECNLLTFIGYWSETWSDYLESLDMYRRVFPYIVDQTIGFFNCGDPFMILEGTPVFDKRKEYGIYLADQETNERGTTYDIVNWWSEQNPTLTLKERVFRRLIHMQMTNFLHLQHWRGRAHLLFLDLYIKSNYEKINKLIADYARDYIPPVGTAENMFNDSTAISSFLLTETVNLDFTLTGEYCNSWPHVIIKVNEQEVVNTDVVGTIVINETVNVKKDCPISIQIHLTNKNNDTLMDNGIILQDKCIKFDRIYVNKFDMLMWGIQHALFEQYNTDRVKLDSCNWSGIWSNGYIQFVLDNPIEKTIANLNLQQVTDQQGNHDLTQELVDSLLDSLRKIER